MLLYIDGTVRAESRTRELADYLAEKIHCNTEYVRLADENILPMNIKMLTMRNAASQKVDFSNPYFNYAKQFAKADEIILATPYWDL